MSLKMSNKEHSKKRKYEKACAEKKRALFLYSLLGVTAAALFAIL